MHRLIFSLLSALAFCLGFAAETSSERKFEALKVEVTVTSDFKTWVSIPGARAPQKFWEIKVMLAPGDYEVIGRRKEYKEIRKALQVRTGQKPVEVHVACSDRDG